MVAKEAKAEMLVRKYTPCLHDGISSGRESNRLQAGIRCLS